MSNLRVSREEMLRLLGAVPPATPAPFSSKNPIGPIGTPPAPNALDPVLQATAVEPSDKKPSLFTPVHFLLARALPRLWHFAQCNADSDDLRVLHRKLRELMAWALSKEGYIVELNVPTPYRRKGELLEGRLELLVVDADEHPRLAIETDWSGEVASLLKLEALHRRHIPGLWVVGQPCKLQDLAKFRTLANRTLRQATGTWLAIYHLEHGWVRAARPKSPD